MAPVTVVSGPTVVRAVRASTHLEGHRWALVHAFANDPSTWLPLPAAALDGGRWLSTVHGGPLLQTVEIRIGAARDLPDAFIRQIAWTPGDRAAAVASKVLPSFKGRLRLEHRQPPGARLVLEGNYRPPGGRPGSVADALVLHRAADATARRFVADVAGRLRRAALAAA